MTEHIYEREIDARLQVEDPSSPSLQERKVIVASLPPPQVRVSVSGKGRDLLQLVGEELLVRLKPEGRAGSVRTYRLTPDLVENRVAQLGVKVEQIIAPKDIEIALDWRAEREVPVKPSVELSIAEHYIQVGETRIDCRDQCFACGILPKLKDLRRETPAEAWECPPVSKIADRRRRPANQVPVSSIGEL